MQYCTNCGAMLTDNAKFCIRCGAQQEKSTTLPEQAVYFDAAPQTMQIERPPKKKKTALWVCLGILGTVLLIGIVLIAVLAVRSIKAKPQGLGVYTAVSAQNDEVPLDVNVMYPNGFTVTLKRWNICELRVSDDVGRGTWTLDGTQLHVQGGGLDCYGTLSDGVMVLYDVLGTGIDMTFAMDGTSLPVKPVTTAATEEAPTLSSTEAAQPDGTLQFWNGDWYGWWIITEAAGEYAGMDDVSCWWDCCAQIELSADGSGKLILWDEDGSRDETMAYADVQLIEGKTGNGCLASTSGEFYDCEIKAGDWHIDPGDENYENLITITGTFVDPYDAQNSYSYTVCLRPWGTDWSDIAQEDEDLLPYYYEDWYLSLIESGAQMPDRIG